MYDFRNRTGLITGANGGISRATAKLFYECGANLLLADIEDAALAEFGKSLDQKQDRVVTCRMDVTKSEDADAAAALCLEHFGGVDFLVTAAGLFPQQSLMHMTDAQWRSVIAINLDGAFYISRAVIPALRDNSAIVHVSSLAGHTGRPDYAHYSAAKGGILTFARSLAKDLAPRTRVNSVSPGVIDTPMVTPMQMEQEGEALIANTPMKRIGRPEEVASAIAFLCSDAASFITAETLHVNGGIYIA